MEHNSGETVEIRIVYKCESTKPNEKVKLVGSLNELGSWDPCSGVDLLTDKSSFPHWTATIFLSHQDQTSCKQY